MAEIIIEKAMAKVSREESAKKMAELLMDDTVSTYKMFEELCSLYIDGSEEAREAIERTVAILTNYRLTSIAEQLLQEEVA